MKVIVQKLSWEPSITNIATEFNILSYGNFMKRKSQVKLWTGRRGGFSDILPYFPDQKSYQS